MGLLKRWQEYRRQYGAAGLLRHLVMRVLRPAWETASVEILVLAPPAPAVQAKATIEIRKLRPDEGLVLPGWTERWELGDTCYVATLDGVYVHHSWVTVRNTVIGEVHGRLRLAPGEAYIYDCFTNGNYRGLGIFPGVLSRISQELFAGGTSRIWIAVEEENRSSIRAIQRAGFQTACEIAYRRAFGRANHSVTRSEGAPPCQFDAEG